MLSYEIIRVGKSALKPNPKELKVRKCNVCKFSRSIAMDGRHHDLLVHSIIVNSTAGNKHYARLCSIVLHSIRISTGNSVVIIRILVLFWLGYCCHLDCQNVTECKQLDM